MGLESECWRWLGTEDRPQEDSGSFLCPVAGHVAVSVTDFFTVLSRRLHMCISHISVDPPGLHTDGCSSVQPGLYGLTEGFC